MSATLVRLAIVSVVLLAAGAREWAAPAQLPVAMTGGWAGVAQIVDPWTELPALEVTLFVAPDGRTNGSVGGATLRNARFERNRGMFGRFFRVRSDWIVTGTLDGPLMRAERLRAARAAIPLNWVRDHFEGGVLAYESNPAGARNHVLTAKWLRLSRLR